MIQRNFNIILKIIYSFILDELIRQVTISCVDQGLILYRIRNEFLMSLSAHENLYESGIAFGIRMSLIERRKNAQIEKEVKTMSLIKFND